MWKRVIIVCLLLILLSACKNASSETPDPHEGMIQVENGIGGKMWVPLIEDLPPSSLKAENFLESGTYLTYSDESRDALRGIDVSFYQNKIDWAKVAADGVEFCIIRAGYRGYGEGSINEDECFVENINGALAEGLLVGIYFFSQAINTDEAIEEARFVLDLVRGYDISLPIFFDWEHIDDIADGTRTDHVSGDTLSDCALAFCSEIENAGYDAGVYFYRSLGYHSYDLSRLSQFTFWAAALGTHSDFYYEHSFWQYSITGNVSGIDGETDLNLWFVPKYGDEPSETQ